MTSPAVSIIMNCLNGERFLREALDSVRAQTFQDWELIFWDNGSTDRSREIAAEYGPRVRVYRTPGDTVPLGAARNMALREARGEFVAFLDTDDVWYPHTLQRLIDGLSSGDYALAYGGIVEIDADGNELRTLIPTLESGAIFPALLKQFDVTVPGTVLRHSALVEHDLSFDPTVTASEEYCLFMQLAVNTRFCVIHQVLARYRVLENSLTEKAISKWAAEREYTLARICERHPGIMARFPAEFREAYARATYYRARFFMATGRQLAAATQMARIALLDRRYFALFILSLIPGRGAWDYVHARRTGRRVTSSIARSW